VAGFVDGLLVGFGVAFLVTFGFAEGFAVELVGLRTGWVADLAG
jgi:hypothetical protein